MMRSRDSAWRAQAPRDGKEKVALMLMALIARTYRTRRAPRPYVPARWRLIALPSTAPQAHLFSTTDRAAESEGEFEQFIGQHERDVFGYLWRMTGNEQAAYDLSQETFLRAWRHFARVAAYDQPRAWLFRVATRLALNYRRDRRPDTLSLDVDAADALATPTSDPAARTAQRDAIESALLALPRRLRAALILRDVYGYHTDEIASVLQVSRAAAKMTISRAREQFRASYLGEEAGR